MNQYSVYGRDNEYYVDPSGNSNQDVIFAESQSEYNVLFENKGGVLESIGQGGLGLNYKGTSRSAAYLDFDQDGDLDILVNEYQGPARLFENHADNIGNAWLTVRLVGKGKDGVSRDAIGATVTVITPDGTRHWEEVHSTTGYLSGHPKTLHFGLGHQIKKVDIEIKWPDGSIQIKKSLAVNRKYVISIP
jgi:hypothetical protein